MGQSNGKKGKGGTRRAGRILAFQVLYGQGFSGPGDLALDKQFQESPAMDSEKREGALAFARELAIGVSDRQDELDKVIERHSQHWKLKRIARVEMAILRLAVYEMLFTDIPLKVAINEAIELSKDFGDDGSRNFINGILDGTAKSVSRGEHGVEKTF